MLKKELFLKKLTLFGFLIVFVLPLRGSGQIRINKWIHKPTKEELHNSLIYIDFWATWCAPCISSMPHTQALEKKFGSEVLFLYISDEPENKIKSFMERRRINFYTANDTEHYNYDHFNIKAIPVAMLLDPNGNIIWQGKPWELDEPMLKRFISKYGLKEGKDTRIKLQKQTELNETEKYTIENNFSLKYKSFDYDIPFKLSHKNHQIIYQGSLINVLSKMLQVEPYQIKIQGDMTYWEVVFSDQFESQQREVAELFLKSAGLNWQKLNKKFNIYKLKEQDTTGWLSRDLYQYAESPDQSLSMIDDYFLTIDNASPKQLAHILSDKTPWIFTYEGVNNQVYDWNIRIDGLGNLLKNLISDLNFKIIETEKQLPVYTIK